VAKLPATATLPLVPTLPATAWLRCSSMLRAFRNPGRLARGSVQLRPHYCGGVPSA
jgi:hypothetical protein